MIIEPLIRILALSINVGLGILAYRRNPRSATHVFLFLLTISILAWGIANEFSVNATTEASTLFWARLVMFFAVPLTIFFFLLMYVFPRATLQVPKKSLWLLSIVAFVTMITAISPYLFLGVESGVGSSAKVIPGPGILVFISTAILSIGFGLFVLIKKNLTLTGLEKLQARYLLLGTLTMFVLITGLSFFPVIVAKNAAFVPYSPLFTLPFVIATAYAIVRYRFMDIRTVIFRTFFFSALTLSFLVIYGFLLYVITIYFEQFQLSALQNTMLGIGSVALAIPSFYYFRLGLRKVTDKFLFQDRTDYKQSLVQFGQALSRTIKIEEVEKITLQAIHDVVRSKRAVILLRNDRGTMVPVKFKGTYRFDTEISADHLLLSHLRHTQAPIIKDELTVVKEKETSLQHKKELEEIENSLADLDISAVVPIFAKKELMGVLLLDDKLSGKPYLQDDIEFLDAFMPQASTALENARLYQESLEFGMRLKDEVRKATEEVAEKNIRLEELAQKLQTANVHLEQLLKIKTEFLQIASHQLRTPVSVMRGALDMLRNEKETPLKPEQRIELIDSAHAKSEKLTHVIDDILSATEMDEPVFDLSGTAKQFDLRDLAEREFKSHKDDAEMKGLALTFEPTEQQLLVKASETYLPQAMANLIDNAIKYTSEGSVTVKVYPEDGYAVFAVQDTGMGVPKEDISKLWTKFQRAGNAKNAYTDGSGLGLFIIKKIVEGHQGGEVFVDSSEGQGSTFGFKLPMIKKQ